MTNSLYSHMLEETSLNLNMTRQHLKADMRRLAEYWEVALRDGNIDDVNIAILILDTIIHGYLKAKGIDVGNRKMLKKDHMVLTNMILLISMYVWEQPDDCFSRINRLTPLTEHSIPQVARAGRVLDEAERILREKSESNYETDDTD